MKNNRAIKITSQGQITLPKDVRNILATEIVRLEVDKDNIIRIIPIKDVAGSLAKYAKKITETDFNVIRQQAWDESIKGRF